MAINVLDSNLGDKLDRIVESIYWFDKSFKSKAVSVMVIDPNGDFTLKDYDERHNETFIKYFDLSECKEGDYTRIGRYFNDWSEALDGVIFDNANCIPEISDKEVIEQIVISALKREDDLQILPFGEPISFDKMMVGVRCKEYPEYLKGKSLQSDIIEVHS